MIRWRTGVLALLMAGSALGVRPAAAEYVVSSNTGALRRYDASGTYLGDVIGPANGLLGAPQHMAWHDGRILVCGYSNHLVSVVDPASGDVLEQWSALGARNPAFLRLSPDGQELWVSFLTSDRIVRFDPDDGTVLGDLVQPGLIDAPHGIEVLADDSWLITSADDVVYRVSAYDQVQAVATVPSPGRPLNTLVLPDGDTVVVTSFVADTTLSVRTFRMSDGAVLGAFSPTLGLQADGLVRGQDGSILVVYWGSGAVGRYADDGTFLGWLVPPGAGLSGANHVLWTPDSALGIAPAGAEAPGARLRLVGASPFRERTAVRFRLDAAGPVELTVAGVDGRRVRTLHAGELPAGVHVRAWDGRDRSGRPVPAGVYWLRLAADGRSEARSVVRLR